MAVADSTVEEFFSGSYFSCTNVNVLRVIKLFENAVIAFHLFMIMEQDTPSIAVRLRWGGMCFLEKTKIQHFLLTSFQHLNDLYPCSRMANNLNFRNCYGLLLFRLSRVGVPCQDGW